MYIIKELIKFKDIYCLNSVKPFILCNDIYYDNNINVLLNLKQKFNKYK